MKKAIVIFLVLVLFTLTLPTLSFAKEEIWNGTIADRFAAGDGSADDPYQIATPAQLAYFAQLVNEGNDFAFKHVVLTSDLYLNDETFSFDADSGMILVSDGRNQRYFGTGIAGDAGGSSTAFDKTPSEKGKWYLRTTDRMVEGYAGNYNHFTPIGGENKPFLGFFDGAGHTIRGLMMISSYSISYWGLFGRCEGGTISRLNIENALVVGNSANTGAIAGSGGNISGCRVSAMVIGENQTGGIAGKGNVSLGRFSGVVIGTGLQNVGGIVGTGNVCYSRNEAPVYGTENVGGIAGYGNGLLEYCENNASVLGEKYVGGIAGIGTVEHATNYGAVTASLDPSGGIVGKGTVSYSANHAEVIGRNYVGGIAGEDVGGGITYSYNTGKVSGDSAVGGIAGVSRIQVSCCYNMADVSGGYTWSGGIGGIVGSVTDFGGVSCCYNIGNVRAPLQVGAIAGSVERYANVSGCFYRKGCAEDDEHKTHNGIGSDKKGVSKMDVKEKTTALPDGAMKVPEMYVDPFFTNHFEVVSGAEYPYPTLKSLHHGAHTYDQKIEKTAYLLHEGDCRYAKTYYYACACGMVGDDTYTVGDLRHVYDGWIYEKDAEGHYHVCTKCGETIEKRAHSYGDEPSDVKYPSKGEDAEIIYTCAVCEMQKVVRIAGLAKAEEKVVPAVAVAFLVAGIVLGVLGTYGAFVIRDLWKKIKE